MADDGLELDSLDVTQQRIVRAGWPFAEGDSAGIDECEWIPQSVGQEVRSKLRLAVFHEERCRRPGYLVEAFMTANTVEPISGIVVVRFAAVNNRVEEAPGGGRDFLGQRMGVIKMIVPEQGDAVESRSRGLRDGVSREPSVHLGIQRASREPGWTRVGAETRQVGYPDELKEFS